MLVLTRSFGESIVVGDNIRITVLKGRGDKVRLSIDAPREVKIHRLEVFEAIKREKANGE